MTVTRHMYDDPTDCIRTHHLHYLLSHFHWKTSIRIQQGVFTCINKTQTVQWHYYKGSLSSPPHAREHFDIPHAYTLHAVWEDPKPSSSFFFNSYTTVCFPFTSWFYRGYFTKGWRTKQIFPLLRREWPFLGCIAWDYGSLFIFS